MTVTLPNGAVEFDDDGRFIDFRSPGCKVVQFDAGTVKVFTTEGTILEMKAVTPIEVHLTQGVP